MGCLGSFISLIISLFKTFILIIGYITAFLIAFIVKLIKHIKQTKKEKQQKENKYVIPNDYQYKDYIKYKNKLTTNIDNNKSISKETTKNITNSYSYLKLYINKKHQGLRKNDELNYKLLGIESYDAPTVYYDEFAEVKGYNVFESDECSSEKYGNLLEKIYNLYGNNFYATIGYEENQVAYKITVKDNKIYLNGKDIQSIKDRYLYLKNKIISFSDNLYDYFIYIEDDNYYYDVVPNDDLDCDSIETLANKLKKTEDILIFEIPYMEEISMIIDIIEPKILKEYQKRQKEAMDRLPDIEVIEEPIFEPDIKNKKKEKRLSWKEEEFEREADLWGLSEEDRRIAKEERMTPAEFIEAEEYDDDELLKDEWER